jgi:RNA polymerase primary sigma factor
MEKIFDNSTEFLKLYFKQVSKIPEISPNEFDYLYKRFRKGDLRARKRLIEGNLKLVVSIVARYQNQHTSFMDLIEEGNLGLMRAIEKYQKHKGSKFSTYAVFWIKQSIRRSIDNTGKTIRIPSYAVDNIRKWIHYWEDLKSSLGRNPSLKEATDNLNLSVKELKSLFHALDMSKGAESLDAKITDDENVSVGDMLEDKNINNSPEDLIDMLRTKEYINEVMEMLNEKEKLIVIKRFGLDRNPPMTLAEIGREIHVSRERVRQILEVALCKMRKFLKDYGDTC